jgi:hypothetical protein
MPHSRIVKTMSKARNAFAAASVAALLVLSACENKEEVVDTSPDPQAGVLANAAPVEAPPMIQASRTYRCKDNSLLYADFYTDNSVRVRTEASGEATTLTATDGKPPFVAEGYSLSENSKQVSYTAPGKGTLSCKA